ncbi:MAG: hypothetical protein WCE62_05445 [Polyangiales bacterium]
MSESGIMLIVWLAAAGLVGSTLAVPQPVDPWEMPSLVLDRNAVSDAIGLDTTLAKEMPDADEAHALRSLFLQHGRSEANPPYTVREYDERQAAIHWAVEALVDKYGMPAFEAMRANAVTEFVRVFGDGAAKAHGDYEASVLGGIREVLEQYGALYRGVVVAPPLTVRAFYKARWNSVHRRPFVEGFSQVELQAYWGWLALHAWGKPLEQREDALIAFRDAGGRGTEEAAAMFDVLGGRPDRAAGSLEKLYSATGELRLRNLALGLRHTALLPIGSP